MNKVQLYKEIGLIDDNLITEAETAGKKSTHKKTWVRWSAVAACLTLILTVGIFRILLPLNGDFDLKLSVGKVKVNYTENIQTDIPSTSSMLAFLTEDELFTKYNTVVFKGIIDEIGNIEISFNGSMEYRAIAKIKVDKVYRGDITEGDTISVLLPCPVNGDIWVEDTGVVSSMRAGMTGIFMPVQYDETSYRSENGTTLYWLDIANYGFLDGERYAFLETDKGVIFADWAYESIANANSLDEIEQYIVEKIQ